MRVDGLVLRLLGVALLPGALVGFALVLYYEFAAPTVFALAVRAGWAAPAGAVLEVAGVVVGLVLLASLPFALRSARAVGGRIASLGRVIDEIGRGNLEARVDSRRADPLRPLSRRVNAMAAALQSMQSELRERVDSTSREIDFLGSHDGLTGLANRRELEMRLEQLLEHAREHGSEHALCFMDLDQFKVVNDAAGHDAGDELLRQIANRLRQKVREHDVLARVGGDEFALLLENCTLDDAYQIATQLRDAVQSFRFAWKDRFYALGASIGVVVVNPTSESVASLLSKADAACYTAKDLGRNRVFIYQEDDEARHSRVSAMEWVPRIARAFEEDRFELFCQRIAPLAATSTHDHYEILVRIREAGGRIVLPMAFVPAAERYNLMMRIDRWVVSNSLALLRRLEDAGRRTAARPVRLSINLSGSSLCDDGFANFLADEIEFFGVSRQSLCFEVTETAAITHVLRATNLMTRLRATGCRFVLDDFGAGLSSFSYLRHLPVDGIKMDGAFVRGIATNAMDFALVRAINDVGHAIGITTTAEFVEDNAIRAKLMALGVDYGQGNGIHEPAPVAVEFAELLAAGEREDSPQRVRAVTPLRVARF